MNHRVVVLHKQHPSYSQEELLHGYCNTVSERLNIKYFYLLFFLMRRKLKSVIVVSLFVAASLSFLVIEYATEPTNTSVVSQSQVKELIAPGVPFNKTVELSSFGDSELIHIAFYPLNRTIWGYSGPTMLEMFKTSQNLDSPLSSITFLLVSLKETMQNNTIELHPYETNSNGALIRYSYTVLYQTPGNYTVNFAITIRPLVEWGPIHIGGTSTTIDITQNLTVYDTPP